MSSIIGIISRKNESVHPFLVDLLFNLRHRGNDYFEGIIGKKHVKEKSLRKIRDTFIEGSTGLIQGTAFGKSSGAKAEASEKSSGAKDGTAFSESSGAKKNSSNKFFSVLDGEFYEPPIKLGLKEKNIKHFISKTNGIYCIAIKKQDSLYAFRDFLGVKPLWFGFNDSFFAFASEPNALKKLNITFPQLLPPGTLLAMNKKGIKTKQLFDLNSFRKSIPKKTSLNELKDSLIHSTKIRCNELEKAAVLFSGGIDSTIIAKLVSDLVPKTTLFTVGVEEAEDLSSAEKVAGELGLKLKKRVIKKNELIPYALKTLKTLSFFDEMQLQIALPEFIIAEEIKKNNFNIVFSGQGSDELFAGYHYYAKILKEKGEKQVEEEIINSLSALWSRNLFREDIIFSRHSLLQRTPFLDKEFLKKALSVPVKEKIYSEKDELRKRIVRKLARNLKLPEEVCIKPKRALQYSTGVSKELNKLF